MPPAGHGTGPKAPGSPRVRSPPPAAAPGARPHTAKPLRVPAPERCPARPGLPRAGLPRGSVPAPEAARPLRTPGPAAAADPALPCPEGAGAAVSLVLGVPCPPVSPGVPPCPPLSPYLAEPPRPRFEPSAFRGGGQAAPIHRRARPGGHSERRAIDAARRGAPTPDGRGSGRGRGRGWDRGRARVGVPLPTRAAEPTELCLHRAQHGDQRGDPRAHGVTRHG